MSRPRAGHSLTAIRRTNGELLWLITDWSGRWMTTGEAKGWPRCPRCRKPTNDSPFGSDLCSTCYFYKTGLPVDEFWRIHESGYRRAPYNIGKACMSNYEILHSLNQKNAKWRTILQNQSKAVESTKAKESDNGDR